MAATTIVDNKTFVRSYFDAISGKDKPSALVEQYVTDVNLQQQVAMFEAAFPNFILRAEDMIAEGDKVAIRARFRGVHNGEFMGLAATGNSVDFPFQVIYRIAQGKIVEHWMCVNQMSLVIQLNVAK